MHSVQVNMNEKDEEENGFEDADSKIFSSEEGRRKDWVPFSPGGTPLPNLADESEASAWRNLMRDVERKNLPYEGRTALERRGYTVKQVKT